MLPHSEDSNSSWQHKLTISAISTILMSNSVSALSIISLALGQRINQSNRALDNFHQTCFSQSGRWLQIAMLLAIPVMRTAMRRVDSQGLRGKLWLSGFSAVALLALAGILVAENHCLVYWFAGILIGASLANVTLAFRFIREHLGKQTAPSYQSACLACSGLLTTGLLALSFSQPNNFIALTALFSVVLVLFTQVNNPQTLDKVSTVGSSVSVNAPPSTCRDYLFIVKNTANFALSNGAYYMFITKLADFLQSALLTKATISQALLSFIFVSSLLLMISGKTYQKLSQYRYFITLSAIGITSLSSLLFAYTSPENWPLLLGIGAASFAAGDALHSANQYYPHSELGKRISDISGVGAFGAPLLSVILNGVEAVACSQGTRCSAIFLGYAVISGLVLLLNIVQHCYPPRPRESMPNPAPSLQLRT